VLDLHRYEIIDWDDPEVDPDPETNNLLHCQQAGHLGAQAELIVYESLFYGPWAEVKFKVQTAQYAVVGLALSSLWLLLLKTRTSAPTGSGRCLGGLLSVRRSGSGSRRPERRGRESDER